MYYTQKSQSTGRTAGIVLVLAFHGALAAGLLYWKRDDVSRLLEPITTEIIEEVDIPDEEPPPPPPIDEIDLTPPPDQVILPEISFDVPAAANAITQVDRSNDPKPVPKPAPPTPKPEPKAEKVGCNLPKRLEKPPYPSRSERLNEEGVTTMRVCVSAKGRATEATVTESSGFPRLDEAAVEWAMGLRNMQPAMEGKTAVDGCCMVVPLAWQIEEGR